MSKKEQPINVLIIDDKQDYCDALAGSARAERILIKSATNLEDGIEILKNNRKIEFVILDGKCFANADKELTGATSNNIPHRAKSLIDQINVEQNREINYCVNTGFVDDLQESFEDIFIVFDKDKKSSEDLYSYIKHEVGNSPSGKLKRKYLECFEVFDEGIIDDQKEHLLMDVLECLEKSDFRKKNFSSLRDLLEALFIGLINEGCIPNDFLTSRGNPNQEWCTIFLEERDTKLPDNSIHRIAYSVPKHIRSIVRKLKESLNENLHLGENEIMKYEYLSNTYIMLELLNWIPQFVRTNYR